MIRTCWQPSLWIALAARRASASDLIVSPESRSASYTFGVTTSARGMSERLTCSTASGLSRGWPLLATITGSTTRDDTLYSSNFLLTASTISAEDSIPVLTAATSKSSKIASSCASMTETGRSWTAVTPFVF